MPEPDPVDLSEFLAAPRTEACIVARSLQVLSDEDRVKFEMAMSMPQEQAPTARVVAAFWARDIRINKESVARHRKGVCPCVR